MVERQGIEVLEQRFRLGRRERVKRGKRFVTHNLATSFFRLFELDECTAETLIDGVFLQEDDAQELDAVYAVLSAALQEAVLRNAKL